jgi:hypothetical protein
MSPNDVFYVLNSYLKLKRGSPEFIEVILSEFLLVASKVTQRELSQILYLLSP